jgi:biotin transporter BioY
VSWLKYSVKLTWEEAIAFGVLPFLTGMVIKIIVAVILGSMLRIRMSKIK